MSLSTVLFLLLAQQSLVAGEADGAKTSVSEQSIIDTYKRMEDADRKGDANAWFALRDKKTLDSMSPALKEAMRKGAHARPSVRYEPLTVRVRNDRAALLGKVVDPAGGTTQHQSVLFVIEDGKWKVSREQWSDSPFDQFVLYGLLPPDGGAFTRGGSPWKRVAYAAINTDVVGKKDVMWKMQATFDESFLYVRYEWIAEIPAPGARVKSELANAGKTGGPPAPPPMQVKVDGKPQLTVTASDVLSTMGDGKSTVNYSLSVKNEAGDDVFEYSVGNDTSGHLLVAQERFIDVRIPLGGLGLSDLSKAKIELEEAGSVLRLLPYTVERFSR